MTKQWTLSFAGAGIMAVAAMAGCSSNSQPAAVVNPAVGVAPSTAYPPAYPPAAYPPANIYTTEEEPAYGTRPPVRTVSAQQFDAQQPSPQQPYPDARRSDDPRQPYYADRPPYEERRTRVVTRERSFGHSAAIVGGSAGAGAAIGAVAGGGKGAGIGALAGGAGGFIYDRLTHRKQVVVEER
jgi:hypothetical protein